MTQPSCETGAPRLRPMRSCPQCQTSLGGIAEDMIGDIGVCPRCKAEFTIRLETEAERFARVTRGRWFRATLLLVIGIWITAAAGVAIIAGGFAILVSVNLAAGLILTLCGVAKAKAWRDRAPLYVMAVTAILLSWFIFSENRDWPTAYRICSVLSEYGYSDVYDLTSRNDFVGRVGRGEIKLVYGPDSLRTRMERAKSQDISFADLSSFKLRNYFRLVFWPPLPFISDKGCRRVFDAVGADNDGGPSLAP